MRLLNVGTPASDDELRFKARGLAGASFDPRTEDVSLVVRDLLIATIPGGSAGWTATPSTSPTTYGYNDPAGTLGGIVQIVLRATPSFTTGFRALVDVRGRDLGGATDAIAGTAVLRVGNDCWSDTTPCAAHGAGVLCRGRTQP